jgi:hypothetical protein
MALSARKSRIMSVMLWRLRLLVQTIVFSSEIRMSRASMKTTFQHGAFSSSLHGLKRLAQCATVIAMVFGATISVAQCPWPIIGSSPARATTDGLLFARLAASVALGNLVPNTGFATGDSELDELIDDEIRAAARTNRTKLDLNDNGVFDLFDAGMIVRHLLGFKQAALVVGNNAGPGALRTTGAQVQTYIDGGCLPTRFTLSGTITGLGAANAGLVLQNNGADFTTVAQAAGTFTMTTALPSGSGYNITVQTQPSGTTCTVTAPTGTGTVVTANVTNVQITCGVACVNPGGSPAGTTSVVVGSGQCASGVCPATCASFNRSCCSNSNVFAGTCRQAGSVAECNCVCQ